jgi:hypothetical protein
VQERLTKLLGTQPADKGNQSKKAESAEHSWVDYVHDPRKDDPTANPPHPASIWRGDYY